MSNFRRYFIQGGMFFFTVVTAERVPIFREEFARHLLGEIFREVRIERPFDVIAIVLLPDHLHAIWQLPPQDDDYSTRWQAIKARFTSQWLAAARLEQPVSDGYHRQRRRGVWQARFMEHTIRDEDDLENHANYIHYNPVKHGYVQSPREWRWSSFHRFVRLGQYASDWGRSEDFTPKFATVDEQLIE